MECRLVPYMPLQEYVSFLGFVPYGTYYGDYEFNSITGSRNDYLWYFLNFQFPMFTKKPRRMTQRISVSLKI